MFIPVSMEYLSNTTHIFFYSETQYMYVWTTSCAHLVLILHQECSQMPVHTHTYTFSQWAVCLSLRPVYRCHHCHFKAHQPHRQKCVFQSQDNRTSQILCAPKQWRHWCWNLRQCLGFVKMFPSCVTMGENPAVTYQIPSPCLDNMYLVCDKKKSLQLWIQC